MRAVTQKTNFNKKISFAALTMLTASTVIATTPFAASASCSNPLSSVVNTGCDIADVDFEIEENGGVALTSEDVAVSAGGEGGYSSVLTNNGTISFANADSEEDIDVSGLEVGGALTGSIINNGSITFTSNTTDDIDSYGIRIGGDNNGAITNNGTITITGTSEDSEVTNYGIYISNDSNGSITNNGVIDITSISEDSSADAYGIYVGSELNGEITNNGVINVTAIADTSSADGYGIYVSGDVNGTITNNGTIKASASAESDSSADAYGMDVGNVLGSIINNGTITATATNEDYDATAYGIEASDVSGSILNSGTINATATNEDYDATAYGIQASSVSGSIINSGTINATSNVDGIGGEGGDRSYAYGMNVNTITLIGSVENSGAINVVANNTDNSADGYGISVGTINGSLTNSGNITVNANSTDNDDFSYGIYINNFFGTVTNSGIITSTNQDNDGNAYSLYINGGEGGVVNNSGILSGNLSVSGDSQEFNNSGIIALPSVADGFIDGPYNQSVAGSIAFGVQGEDNYATLDIDNTATFATGTKLRVTLQGGNTYSGGDLLDVVTTNSLTSADNFAVLDNSLAYNFAGVKDGNTIDITSSATGLTTLAAALGGSSNGAGAASVLEDYLDGTTTPPAELLPLLDMIGSATNAQGVSNALSQTLPLLSGGVEQAISDAIGNTSKVVEARLEDVSGLSSGDDSESEKAVWLRTFGSWATQDATDRTAGYDANTVGAILGGDKLISEDVRLGVAVVYSNTNLDVNSSIAPQNNDISSYQGVVYGTYSLGELTDLNFQADIGLNKNEGERNILAAPAVASSEFDSWSHHIGTAVRHLMTVNESTSFIPSVSLDFTNISTDGYTETGAGGLNLNVAENEQQSLVLGVDGKVEHKLSETFAVNANLGAGYDMLADRSSITSNYVGGGAAFTTNGVDKDPLILSGGVGFVLNQFQGVEVSADYDAEIRTSDYTNQTASIKLRMPF
jgi:outer membrane autotransporter protein